MKYIQIEKCSQCPNISRNYNKDWVCMITYSENIIKDQFDDIPKWCPLDDLNAIVYKLLKEREGKE